MGSLQKLCAGALLAFCGIALLAQADEEAVCADGRKVRGALTVEGGALRFVPDGQTKPLAFEAIEGVRFSPADAVVPRAGNSLRALLADGQHITGELLKIDADQVHLRPAWSTRIDLARSATVALMQPPGYRTLFADDLDKPAKPWKADGSTLTYPLPTPMEAGRVGVTFQVLDKAADKRCQLEATFQVGSETRTIKLVIAGTGDNCAVEAAGLKGEPRKVLAKDGPHRLVLQFTKQSMRVTCDDDVLWHNLEQGPGGPLTEVQLQGGAVAWSAFYVARAVDECRHPPGDTDQDEVWLASDDQLFGTVKSADRGNIELEGRFGKRSVPWADVLGVFFRRPKSTAPLEPSKLVRVWLRTGFGNETDVLDGVLLRIGPEKLTLKHADLGELSLDRKWLLELRPRLDSK
jgi:hypothetical protein